MEKDGEVKNKIIEVIKANIDLKQYKAFFIGSRVNGKSRNGSDFDVGILGGKEVPDEILQKIKDGMESLETLYSVDVIDFSRVGEQFKKVALSSIEEIK